MIKSYVTRHPVRTQRALEILPGVVSWSLILFPVWGSFVIPTVVAYYVITFAVYWLYRSMTIAVLSIAAHFKMRAAIKFDWVADIKINYPDTWDSIHHIIVIPTYHEPVSTLHRTLTALSKQTFPLKNLHIMLSFEEREGQDARKKEEELCAEFGTHFGHLWTTYHPDIEGEVKGRPSNTSWGARHAKELLVDQLNVPIEKMTISMEDADARCHQ